MEKYLLLFVIIFCGLRSWSFSGEAADVTVCNYDLPLKVEKRTIVIKKKDYLQCELFLEKIENFFEKKAKNFEKIKNIELPTYKTIDCRFNTKHSSFRISTKYKVDFNDKYQSDGFEISKVDKVFCSKFPKNSLIFN
jgi:hypothetical protein